MEDNGDLCFQCWLYWCHHHRVGRGGSRLVCRGVSVSRSHMSFYLRTGGGTYVSFYIKVNISWLLILQSLH